MANKKKRKRPTPPSAVAGTTRPPKPKGPSQRELQLAAQEKARRQAALRRVGLSTAVITAAAAVIGGAYLLDRRGDAQLREALTAGSCEVDDEMDPTAAAGQNHVASPAYQVNPPAGGDHLASPARSGVYAEGSVPEDGLLVHSLEHGYVIAWHSPDLPAAQLKQLEAFESENDGDVIVAERADLPVPFAATAWGQRLLCQEVEQAPLQRFFDEHVGNGPESVPRG